MKKFTFIALLSFIMISFTNLNAQTVAHVNSNEILTALPEFKEAQTKLEAETNRHKKEVERQQKELQEIYSKAQAEIESVKDKSDAEKQAVMKKLQPVEQSLQKKQQELAQYQQQAAQEISKKEAELMEPIYTKVEKAITSVGDAKKIGYIFDLATVAKNGSLVYYKGGKDITADVKKVLGLK